MIFYGPKEDLEASEGGRGPHEGGTKQQGVPCWLVGPLCGLRSSPEASRYSFGPENFLKKFRGNWTSFGTVNLKSQKHAENSNWHLALG